MNHYDSLAKKYNIEQLYNEWAVQNNVASVSPGGSPYNNRARQDSAHSETDT